MKPSAPFAILRLRSVATKVKAVGILLNLPQFERENQGRSHEASAAEALQPLLGTGQMSKGRQLPGKEAKKPKKSAAGAKPKGK